MSFQTRKTLLVFRTQFKIFWMKIGRLVFVPQTRHFGDYPLDAKCVHSSIIASAQGCIFFVDLRSDLNANNASSWPGWYRRAFAFCVQWIICKMALRWHRGDVTVPNCWIKSLFLFYFHKKVFSSLYKVQIESLMANGVFRRCFS